MRSIRNEMMAVMVKTLSRYRYRPAFPKMALSVKKMQKYRMTTRARAMRMSPRNSRKRGPS